MRMRTRSCLFCREDFSYPIGKGNDRRHCTADCREKHKAATKPARIAARPLCGIEGCDRRARSRTSGLCETHYLRLYRTGTTDAKPPAYRYISGDGYVSLRDPRHPLATSDGTVREHRAVVYADIGQGPHPCFWCGTVMGWDAIVIDHLNEDKADNRRTNLVVSCNDCNRIRGAMKPFLARLTDEAVLTFVTAALDYRADCKSMRHNSLRLA